MAEHFPREAADPPDPLPYRDDIFAGRTMLRVSPHALSEGHKEGIRAKEIIKIVLTGEVVERYPNRRRVLIAGRYRRTELPIHAVVDYSDYDEAVVTTVYIPSRQAWSSYRQRRREFKRYEDIPVE